ncbi:kinase-like domain-containing protein [Phlebopus sp. FC_14]|nr:kinase-like domain-containing protein [Phlebopus sp. FC_14]
MPDRTNEDLATVAGVRVYLKSTPFASDTVEVLSGGYANFTFRIRPLRMVHNRSTFILKYASPYVAVSAGKMEFDPARQFFEAAALRLFHVSSQNAESALVTVPVVRLFDRDHHVLIIDDCGGDSCTLKQLLIGESLPMAVSEKIGSELGHFISQIHSWDVTDPDFSKNEVAKTMSAFVTYGRLVSTLTGEHQIPALQDPLLGVSEEKLEAISRVASARHAAILSAKSSDALTHGDFWPGNIMVCVRRGTDGAVEDVERLYVLDWELAKAGLPGLDLGQFCAEMHLLSSFHPARKTSTSAVIESFLSVYKQSSRADPELARVALGHIGAHLVAWTPRVSWGGKERTREVVEEGVDLLLLSSDGSTSALQKSVIGPLF